MLKKSMAAVVMVMVFALALAGCGGSDGVMSKGYGDLFRDKAAINKAVTEIKAKGGGTPLMIFQSMHFGPEFINFSRQDPKNKENVDNFVWTPNTGWQGPKIVKLSGGGKLEDNLFNIDDVNWDAIPVFIAETEKLAKETLLCPHSGHDQDQQNCSHNVGRFRQSACCNHGEYIPWTHSL